MHFTQGLGKMSLMTAELAPTRVLCGGTEDYCPPLVYAAQTQSPNPETAAPVSTIFWLHYCATRGSGEMLFICFCHFYSSSSSFSSFRSRSRFLPNKFSCYLSLI